MPRNYCPTDMRLSIDAYRINNFDTYTSGFTTSPVSWLADQYTRFLANPHLFIRFEALNVASVFAPLFSNSELSARSFAEARFELLFRFGFDNSLRYIVDLADNSLFAEAVDSFFRLRPDQTPLHRGRVAPLAPPIDLSSLFSFDAVFGDSYDIDHLFLDGYEGGAGPEPAGLKGDVAPGAEIVDPLSYRPKVLKNHFISKNPLTKRLDRSLACYELFTPGDGYCLFHAILNAVPNFGYPKYLAKLSADNRRHEATELVIIPLLSAFASSKDVLDMADTLPNGPVVRKALDELRLDMVRQTAQVLKNRTPGYKRIRIQGPGHKSGYFANLFAKFLGLNLPVVTDRKFLAVDWKNEMERNLAPGFEHWGILSIPGHFITLVHKLHAKEDFDDAMADMAAFLQPQLDVIDVHFKEYFRMSLERIEPKLVTEPLPLPLVLVDEDLPNQRVEPETTIEMSTIGPSPTQRFDEEALSVIRETKVDDSVTKSDVPTPVSSKLVLAAKETKGMCVSEKGLPIQAPAPRVIAALQTSVAKDSKYKPKSCITVSRRGIVHGEYSHNFKDFPAEVVKQLNMENTGLFEEPHFYCHPGLRSFADILNIALLVAAFNLDAAYVIVEHAAKYHKVLAWLSDELKKRYRCTRPKLDRKDHEYHGKYKAPQCMTLDLYSPSKPPEIDVLHDVIYYESVWARMSEAVIGYQCFFSAVIYPFLQGTYYYYGEEGYVLIAPLAGSQEGDVHSYPRGNVPGYHHGLLNLSHNNVVSIKISRSKYFVVTPFKSFQLGPSIHHSAFHGIMSDTPTGEVRDSLFVKPIPQTVDLINPDGNIRFDGVSAGRPLTSDSSNDATFERKVVRYDERITKALVSRVKWHFQSPSENRKSVESFIKIVSDKLDCIPENNDPVIITENFTLSGSRMTDASKFLQKAMLNPGFLDVDMTGVSFGPKAQLKKLIYVTIFLIALVCSFIYFSGRAVEILVMFDVFIVAFWAPLLKIFLVLWSGYALVILRRIFSGQTGHIASRWKDLTMTVSSPGIFFVRKVSLYCIDILLYPFVLIHRIIRRCGHRGIVGLDNTSDFSSDLSIISDSMTSSLLPGKVDTPIQRHHRRLGGGLPARKKSTKGGRASRARRNVKRSSPFYRVLLWLTGVLAAAYTFRLRYQRSVTSPLLADSDHDIIDAVHFNRDTCCQMLHIPGNDTVETEQLVIPGDCTCQPGYRKVISSPTPIHFGTCAKNGLAGLFARQFNTPLSPSPYMASLFSIFTCGYFDSREEVILRAIDKLTAAECSFEQFLADSEPSKRAIYEKGWKFFLEKGFIPMNFQAFSKSNELHYDKPSKVRPRQLFNPSDSLKAVGGYVARLMIKVMKKVEPGFISGYSEKNLARRFLKLCHQKGIDPTSARFYSYDGSSHDAHQHRALIAAVDHEFMNRYLKTIMLKTDIPIELFDVVLKCLTSDKIRFYNTSGTVGFMRGSVISGHPTLTTLFNTERTILYNRFVHSLIAPSANSLILASGDDLFAYLDVEPSVVALIPGILGGDAGALGLGQKAKDFKIGSPAEHTFLSKKFYTDVARCEMYRLNERLAKAGVAKEIGSPLSNSEHRLMQYLCMVGLPNEQAFWLNRWLTRPLAAFLGSKALNMVTFDWALKYRYLESQQEGFLSSEINFYDSEVPEAEARFYL